MMNLAAEKVSVTTADAIGFESIAVVARRNCVTTRCMRRRLKRAAEKLRSTHPHEPPLLVRFGDRGYFLDRSVAYRYMRGLVVATAADRWGHAIHLLEELRDHGYDLARAIAELHDLVASTHDLVVVRVPSNQVPDDSNVEPHAIDIEDRRGRAK